MNNVPDDVDAALRQWGQQHRHAPDAPKVPAIADLLAERRRHRAFGAVVTTVLLVAVLAVGLGLGIRLGNHQSVASTATTRHGPLALGRDSPPQPPRRCVDEFSDSGSRIATNGEGTVALRYTGDSACTVFRTPQVALVNHEGQVTGPHNASAVLNHRVIVHPGDQVDFTIAIYLSCPGIPADSYTLHVYFRPTAHPSAGTGVTVPLGHRASTAQQLTIGCPALNLVPARTGELVVHSSSTLDRLTRIARREAATDGDPAATAEAVHTRYGQVEQKILGTPMSRSRGDEVWVIQLRGTFTCDSCSVPFGASAPHGTTVVLVLQEPGLRLSDLSVENRHYELAALGTVEPLVP